MLINERPRLAKALHGAELEGDGDRCNRELRIVNSEECVRWRGNNPVCCIFLSKKVMREIFMRRGPLHPVSVIIVPFRFRVYTSSFLDRTNDSVFLQTV